MRVYSFKDTTVTIQHDALGQKVISGTGVGDIVTSFANDSSAHLLSNDGRVITSKIEAPNGTVTINVPQGSDAYDWMINAYNYLRTADSQEWNGLTITIRGPVENVTCTGVSFQKIPDVTRGQQAQQVGFAFLAEEIVQEVA